MQRKGRAGQYDAPSACAPALARRACSLISSSRSRIQRVVPHRQRPRRRFVVRRGCRRIYKHQLISSGSSGDYSRRQGDWSSSQDSRRSSRDEEERPARAHPRRARSSLFPFNHSFPYHRAERAKETAQDSAAPVIVLSLEQCPPQAFASRRHHYQPQQQQQQR